MERLAQITEVYAFTSLQIGCQLLRLGSATLAANETSTLLFWMQPTCNLASNETIWSYRGKPRHYAEYSLAAHEPSQCLLDVLEQGRGHLV